MHTGDESYLYVSQPRLFIFKTRENILWYDLCLK